MNVQNARKRGPRTERGAALLECTIILPFLVMMIAATYDLAGALNQYLTLTRIVYEGARFAATLPGLELNGVHTAVNQDQHHNDIRKRVVNLLVKQGFNPDEFSLISTENSQNEWVTVSVEKKYTGQFRFFDNMPLRVSATGPYLSVSAQDGFEF